MTHPAKDLLIAIAEGKQIETDYARSNWEQIGANHALSMIAANMAVSLRIARPMVTRTVTHPEPLRVKPRYQVTYWTLMPHYKTPRKHQWLDGESDNAIFAAGMAFATEADAAEAHKALYGGGND